MLEAPLAGEISMSDTALAAEAAEDTGFTSLFVTAQDGLRLHVRRYGQARPRAACRSSACPASPATARTSMSLATALTGTTRRSRGWCVAIDFARPRALRLRSATRRTIRFRSSSPTCSPSSPRSRSGAAIFLGTSRGGILAMLLGAARPARDRRRHPQRYRAGDRAQGADAASRAMSARCRRRAASPKAPRSCAGSATRSSPR